MEKLLNEFVVHRPIDQTWAVLTDVERIAPCMPGAQLQEIEGDIYRGVVKVKLGPISTAFKGQAHFVGRDDANHKAVLKGQGRDTGGKGNADALITAQLEPQADGTTKCVVTTELHITGKVAQFGRGQIAQKLARGRVRGALRRHRVKAPGIALHSLGLGADGIERQVLGQPDRLAGIEARDMFAPDQRDYFAKAFSVPLDQAAAMLVLFFGHAVEHLCRGRIVLAQAFGILSIDARVVLFRGDGKRQNLLFGQVREAAA